MAEPLYTTRSTIRKIEGTHRRAHMEQGTDVDFGVHGPIMEHYGLVGEKNLPMPVDYIAAAAGA